MFQKGQLLRLQCKLMSLWFESYSLLSSQVLESHQAFLFSCLIWLALISCFCFHSIILPLKSKKPKKCEILNSVGTFSLNYNDFEKHMGSWNFFWEFIVTWFLCHFAMMAAGRVSLCQIWFLWTDFLSCAKISKQQSHEGQNVDIGQQGSLIMIRFKNKNKKQLREQCAFDDTNSTVNSFPLQNDKSKWYLTNIQCIHECSSSLMTCLSIKSMQSLVLRCVHFTVHCCHLAACHPPPPLPPSPPLFICTNCVLLDNVKYRVVFWLVPESPVCVLMLKLNWFPNSSSLSTIGGTSLVWTSQKYHPVVN